MIQQIDNAILRWVQSHQQPALAYIFRDITSLGGDTLVACFTVFVTGALWITGSRKSARWFCLTMLATAGLIVGAKLLVSRPCPMQPDPFQSHGDFPTSALSLHLPCMPSGHTCGSVVLYSLIYFLVHDSIWTGLRMKKWAMDWLIALPVVIGFSRVYLSAHWTSDVVAGYALGWGIVLVSRKGYSMWTAFDNL